MKQIFTTIALLAMAVSFASCEKEIIVNCNCNCQCGSNSDQTPTRPGDNEDNTPGGGSDNDNTGNDGNGGSDSGTDRSEYTTYNTTFTQGQAGYYGVYYDGQPSNTSNWFLELADNNYDLENYEGSGYNIVLEFFANGTSSSSIPAGKYTVEAYEKSEFSAGSLLYGYIGQDEEQNDFPAGTWLFEGNEGIAAATAGELTVSVSGSRYTINYTLYDDEYEVTFSGSYTGNITIYDGTQDYSNAPATKSARSSARHYRVRL